MHEVSIVNSIFKIIRGKINEKFGNDNIPVKKIRVVVGKMSTVVPRALEFAFEMVSRGTIFEKARIEIEYVPLVVKCTDCQAQMELDEPFMFCRSCDSFNVQIVTGQELYVDTFEIDDEDTQFAGQKIVTAVNK